MVARSVAFVVTALIASACHKPDRRAEVAAPEASEQPPKHESGAGGMDLSAHGLPLVVDVPACAKVSTPAVKIAANAQDLILACEPSDLSSGFAIQIGLAAGKTWKKELQSDPNFKRWIK